jgi:hypothetical protein
MVEDEVHRPHTDAFNHHRPHVMSIQVDANPCLDGLMNIISYLCYLHVKLTRYDVHCQIRFLCSHSPLV